MRFEIRTAGMVLILLGLAALSAVVFALGLAAGYEMARQTAPESAQVASVFPAPSPLPVEPSPTPSPSVQAMTSPAAASSASAEAGANETAPAVLPTRRRPAALPSLAEGETSPARPATMKSPSPAATPRVARKTIAHPESPPEARATAEQRPTPREAVSEKESNSASARTGAGHPEPYNIQIDAVMDHQNAEQMSERIRKLGYPAFLVPTTIDGQTWWRVRVGPYRSQDEARAAQAKLRGRYGAAYRSGRF